MYRVAGSLKEGANRDKLWEDSRTNEKTPSRRQNRAGWVKVERIKSALLRAHRAGLILWYGTVCVLSRHE
jgi:hypothetical protein